MSQDAILPILPRPLAKPDGQKPPLRTTKVEKKSKLTAHNDIQVRPKSQSASNQNKKKSDDAEKHDIDLFV